MVRPGNRGGLRRKDICTLRGGETDGDDDQGDRIQRHNDEATVTVELSDLTECRCSECDETFSAEGAVTMLRENLRQWEKVARWVEMGRELAAE